MAWMDFNEKRKILSVPSILTTRMSSWKEWIMAKHLRSSEIDLWDIKAKETTKNELITKILCNLMQIDAFCYHSHLAKQFLRSHAKTRSRETYYTYTKMEIDFKCSTICWFVANTFHYFLSSVCCVQCACIHIQYSFAESINQRIFHLVRLFFACSVFNVHRSAALDFE